MRAVRCNGLGFVLVVASVATGGAWAVGSRAITVSTAQQFQEGTTEGTRIQAEGAIEIGGEIETLWGPEAGIVWRIGADRQAYWVALSSPGRLVRWSGGNAESWYAPTDEVLMTALALDGSRGVWVGVNPGGRVVRMADREKIDASLETGAAFVWALESSADGTLWIGTGAPGRLLRRTANGTLASLLELGDDPIRCLTLLRSGSAVVGTGSQGRVLRVSSDGRAFALFDAAEDEIVALLEGEDESLWVLAARGAGQPSPNGSTSAAATEVAESVRVVASAPPAAGTAEGGPEGPQREDARAPARRVGPRGGAVYLIDQAGATRRIWETWTETPFAMVRWGDEVVVATGDGGRLYALGESAGPSLVGRIGSEQASALAAMGDELLVGGTTDARLERIRRVPAQSGSYLSRPMDAGAPARWGSVSWRAELPAGSSLGVSARVGNTELPDEFWESWQAIGDGTRGEATLALPAARRLQLRFDLRRNAAGLSPRLLWFESRYLAANHAPSIERLTVEAPGVVWSRPAPQTTRPTPIVADDPRARDVAEGLDGSTARTSPVRKGFEPGARTISWQVRDADGDRIAWRLALARDGNDAWVPIGSGTGEEFSSWDARAFPDGEYRARLTIDDAPDNASGQARTATATSELFTIDHTRPKIETDTLSSRSLRFTALDPGGRLVAIEWALDDGAWLRLEPVDGVTDGPEERCEIPLDQPEARSARALRVRLTDAAGNVGGNVWPLVPR